MHNGSKSTFKVAGVYVRSPPYPTLTTLTLTTLTLSEFVSLFAIGSHERLVRLSTRFAGKGYQARHQ